MNEVQRVESSSLKKLYVVVEELRSEELTTAEKQTKAGLTRMRVKLSAITKLCKSARKELLEMRDGKIGSP